MVMMPSHTYARPRTICTIHIPVNYYLLTEEKAGTALLFSFLTAEIHWICVVTIKSDGLCVGLRAKPCPCQLRKLPQRECSCDMLTRSRD